MTGLKEDRSFFVYAYLRGSDDSDSYMGTPYYIGKGKEGRETAPHLQRVGRNGNGIRDLVPENPQQIVRLASDLTEEEAFEAEKRLISFYGKVSEGTGCRWNHHDGGLGGAGFVYPEYLKEVRRAQLVGNDYGARVDWSNPEIRAKHAAGCATRVYVKTAARKQQDENLKIVYRWRHQHTGEELESCCIDMARRIAEQSGKPPMTHQAGFWKVANGRQQRCHGWACLNPTKPFEPAPKSARDEAQAKAAAVRVERRAKEMGLTVEAYNEMSYGQRSKLFKQMESRGELMSQLQEQGPDRAL